MCAISPVFCSAAVGVRPAPMNVGYMTSVMEGEHGDSESQTGPTRTADRGELSPGGPFRFGGGSGGAITPGVSVLPRDAPQRLRGGTIMEGSSQSRSYVVKGGAGDGGTAGTATGPFAATASYATAASWERRWVATASDAVDSPPAFVAHGGASVRSGGGPEGSAAAAAARARGDRSAPQSTCCTVQ